MSLASPVPGITVLEILAYGGFAVVYRARQESVGREVALKVDNRLAHDERDRRRFLREAHAAGQLSDHPNVISVFDAGITPDGRPYMVMELCPTGSLADRLRKDGPMRAFEVREIGVKIADALETAHQAGVLHRDVKPANILVNRFGAPGLADFGMAANHDAGRHLSATLEALTPAYAPPEVFRMERPTVAVDVYSLGATLYSLLSGRPPRWPADGDPSIATIIGLQDDPILDVPGVPAALTAVLRRALSAAAADRYPSAAAFRDALQGVALEAPTGMFGVIPADVGPGPQRRPTELPVAPTSPAGSGSLPRSPSQGSSEHPSLPGARSAFHSGSGSGAAGMASMSAVSGQAMGGAVAGAGAREAASAGEVSWGSTSVGSGSSMRGAARVPVSRAGSTETTALPRRRVVADHELGVDTDLAPPRRRGRLVVAALAFAAVLGIVAAVATNPQYFRARETGGRAEPLPVQIDPGTPTATPDASPSPSASPSPTRSRARPVPSPPRSRPPTLPPIRQADPVTISPAGLGPFRVGQPATPLLAANLARRPNSDDPCPAADQLLARDDRYRSQATGQILSAHVVSDRIAHVTMWSEDQRTRDGLHVGSTLDELKAATPAAEVFGGDDGSYLVTDGDGALLFVVRNDQVAVIVAGSQGELTNIGDTLSQAPNDIAPLC